MPTMNDETLHERYQREAAVDEKIAARINASIQIKVKRELFSFSCEQDWINKGQSRYAKCGVRKGHYITVDANGHVMHMGLCFKSATAVGAYPVTVYELETNWPKEESQLAMNAIEKDGA